jgi:hypothetical protein
VEEITQGGTVRNVFSRRLAVTTALVLGALIVSVAFATWTTSGSGTGRAKALSNVDATVTARTGGADLYPGVDNGDLYFTVDNPNPYDVTFTSATFGSVTSSDTTACPSATVTVDASVTGLNLTVPAGSTGTELQINDVVNMLATAPNGCQDKTFDIAVTLAQQ